MALSNRWSRPRRSHKNYEHLIFSACNRRLRWEALANLGGICPQQWFSAVDLRHYHRAGWNRVDLLRTVFTPSNLLNILRQSIVLGLLAIGQSLVMLTGGMDISTEMVARLVGLTVATIFAANASNPALIVPLILLGVVMGALLGGINGLLITRTHAVPFIITFGVANILRGINLAISTTPIRGIPEAYLKVYDAKIGIVPVNVIVMALVWYGLWLFPTRIALGA